MPVATVERLMKATATVSAALMLAVLSLVPKAPQCAFAADTTSSGSAKPQIADNAKGAPPDGNYQCANRANADVNLGTLQIKGDTYRGLVTEGDYHNYKVDAKGTITLSSELTGLEDGWKVTGTKYNGTDKAGKQTIEIDYLTKDGKQCHARCERLTN